VQSDLVDPDKGNEGRVQAWILVRDIRSSHAFDGGAPAAGGGPDVPAPPPPPLGSCSNYGELYERSLQLTRSCCDAPGSCEAGMPLECSADCATQLPSFMESCDQFLQLGVNSGLLSTLQSARAGCPAPVPCGTTAEFTAQMAPLNDACCTGGSDCSGGSPSECSSGCADVLLPLLEHCSSYLLLPDNTALHSLLVDAASRCDGGGGH